MHQPLFPTLQFLFDLPTSQCGIAFHEPYLRLIEKLLPVMPHPSLDSFFFWNSGSEAIEAALKMARTITKRQNIICMQGKPRPRPLLPFPI
jgi:4-aminobutyrate aminotransferase-like enzyme